MSFGEEWSCHICKKMRPDASISVISKDTSEEFGMPPGTMIQNIRYCNDNISCSEEAIGHQHSYADKD